MFTKLCTLALLCLLSACTSMPSGSLPPTAVTSATPPATYEDSQLCFTVNLAEGWTTDGVPGGFATFTPPDSAASFQIANVDLPPPPTLASALAELQKGELRANVQEIADTIVDKQAALWVTFVPEAEFAFVALVIAPDCGDGQHSLFIAAKRADQPQFAEFLGRISFPRN